MYRTGSLPIQMGRLLFSERRVGGIFGLVEWRERGSGAARQEWRGGVHFLIVGITCGGLRETFSVRRAVRTLQKNGVRQAVFPEGFLYAEHFARCGVQAVDVNTLRETAAAAIALCAMAQRGIAPESASLVLCAPHVTRAYAKAAWTLARTVRYIRLCTGSGGRELADELRCVLGTAVTLTEWPPVSGSDMLLCFDGAEVSGTQGVVLPLCGGALRVEYETDGDVGGCDPEQMLAARLAAGAIRTDAIRVRNVVWE